MNRTRRVYECTRSGAGAVVLVGLLAATACGRWLSPDPRRLLERSADACRTAGGLRYSYVYEGYGSLAGSFRGEVLLSRRADGLPAFRATVSGHEGAGDERARVEMTLASDGRTASRIDGIRQVFSHGTAETAEAYLLSDAVHAVLSEFLQPRPFAVELGDDGLSWEGKETVDGVDCDVVRSRSDALDGAEVRWSIASDDALPRARTWTVSAPGVSGGFRFEIEGLETGLAVAAEDFVLRAPRGYPSIDEDLRVVDIGTAAPDWTLQSASGEWVTLSSLRGEVVVLDFGASWSPPCRSLMPEIDKLARRRSGEPVRFLALSSWESPAVDPRAFAAELAPDHELLLRGETIAEDYKISALPALFVVDREGSIAFIARPRDAEPAMLVAKLNDAIDRALGGAPSSRLHPSYTPRKTALPDVAHEAGG